MTAPSTRTTATSDLTPAEQQALLRLRDRYQRDHHVFSRQELARLSFLRWLYQTGRISPELSSSDPVSPSPARVDHHITKEDPMSRAANHHQIEGGDTMTNTTFRHTFGQEINSYQLSPLARELAVAIGDGTPAPWAGFVWYHPQAHQRLSQPRRGVSRNARPAEAA